MGCGSSSAQVSALSDANTEGGEMDEKDGASSSAKSYPPGEAFEIPLDDTNSDGLIKKHPPKRLLRLEEQALSTAPPTIEDLEEKLATAEVRRQDYLNQKVNMAKQMQKQLEDSLVADRRENTGVDETNERDIN